MEEKLFKRAALKKAKGFLKKKLRRSEYLPSREGEKYLSLYIRERQYGKNSDLRIAAADQLKELIGSKIPKWIKYDSWDFVFLLDDGCSRDTWHPETPIEIRKALKVLDDTEILYYLILIVSGEIKLSGNKIGQSAKNTCPICKDFLWSGATRRKTIYSCTKCDYEKEIEV